MKKIRISCFGEVKLYNEKSGRNLIVAVNNETNRKIQIYYAGNGTTNTDPLATIDAESQGNFTINNVDEVINWVPDASIQYTDPVREEKVVIYLKDVA